MVVDMTVLWTITSQNNAYGIQVAIPGITDGDEVLRKRDAPSSARSASPPRTRLRQDYDDFGCLRGPGARLSTIRPEWKSLKPKDLKEYMLCKDFQEGTCPAAHPDACPRGQLHRCARWMPQMNQHCGATQHGNNTCNRRAESPGGKGGGKGKGKGKKGKKGKY